MQRTAAALQVLRGGAEYPTHGEQASLDEHFGARMEDLKRDVVALVDGIDGPIAYRDVQADMRVLVAEALEGPPEMAEGETRQNLQAQHAHRRVLRHTHAVGDRIEPSEQLRTLFVEIQAHLRQHHLAGRAVKQGRLHETLQLLHTASDHRSCDADLAGSIGEALRLGDPNECLHTKKAVHSSDNSICECRIIGYS